MELLRSNSRLRSLIILSDAVHTGDESLWDWLGNTNLWNNLGFSLYAMLSVCHMVTISEGRRKSKIRASTNWCITIKYWRSISIRVIFVDY